MAKVMITCRINRDLRDRIAYLAKNLDINFSEAIRIILKTNYYELNKLLEK